MAATLLNVYPGASAVEDGRLVVAGCDVVELAREFGTPAYVVAEDDLRSRAREFTDALRRHHDGPGAVMFAAKAFPATAVLRVFAEEGLHCLVAGGGELQAALRAGFPPARIQLHGNAKEIDELRAAVEAGVGAIVVDSHDDLDRLDAIGARARVLFRVLPEVETDTHAAIATGHADAKFGMGVTSAAEAIERARAGGRLEIAGLHVHIGSQLFDTEPFHAAAEAVASLGSFEVYDMGGGLGVPYTRDDPVLSVDDYVAAKAHALRTVHGAGRTLIVEPGRALTAASAVTLYTVQTVKRGATRTWVAVDGGMSDNLRPMLYGARYEAAIAGRMGEDGERCTIVGKHCESGDELLHDARLPDPRPGDVVVMPTAGAYHHALANNYNGALRPPVIFCHDGDARVVVRRETYEDLFRRDA